MRLSHSTWRKLLATLVAVVAFVLLYEALILDSISTNEEFLLREQSLGTAPAPVVAPKQRQVPAAVPSATTAPAKRAEAAPAQAASVAIPLFHQPTPTLRFSASAYCKGSTTASGLVPRSGIAAADQRLLPVGSVIQVSTSDSRYSGIYTILDTGPSVQGRNIDLYVWNCDEALRFGRRSAAVTVLRLGWNPRDTVPNLIESLFGFRAKTTTANR